jgi:hypothetical protein
VDCPLLASRRDAESKTTPRQGWREAGGQGIRGPCQDKTGASGEREDVSSWETSWLGGRETSVQTTRFMVVRAPGHVPSLSSQSFRHVSSAMVGYSRFARRANGGAIAMRYSCS